MSAVAAGAVSVLTAASVAPGPAGRFRVRAVGGSLADRRLDGFCRKARFDSVAKAITVCSKKVARGCHLEIYST